jgi:hypothetical protein
MAEKDFVVKNGLVVNSAITINSTAIYYNGSQFINSTSFEGTANNTNFVGTVEAANVVSNAQLAANLANYQTSAGMAANVVTLTANNTSFVGTTAAAAIVNTAQLSGNLANYQTSAGMAANVAVLTANNSTRLNGQLASFYTDATNISTGTLASARISGNYAGITNVGTLGTLTVSGNVALNNFSINASTNTITIPTANVNIDSGVLFVDSINNRVGISNTTPDTQLTVTGSANISGDLRVLGSFYITGSTVTSGTTEYTGALTPSSNGVLLGNTFSRWNLSANIANFSGNVTFGSNLIINTTSISYVGNSTTSPTVTIANTGSVLIGNSTTTQTTSLISVANSSSSANVTPAGFFGNGVNLSSLNATSITTGTIPELRLPLGNATNRGALLVLDSVTSTSITDYAASANSVKTAYDVGIAANTRAASAQSAAISAYTNATTFASSADNITSGTLPNARLSSAVVNTSGNFSLSGNTTLAGTNTVISSNLSVSGTFRIGNSISTQTTSLISVANSAGSSNITPAGFFGNFNGNGASITSLNADQITSGALPNARLSSAVVNTSANFTLAGNITFSGNTTLAGTNTAISSNVNITGSFLNVASSFLANSTGAYHTGIVNAATLSTGAAFSANTTRITFSNSISANGGVGTAGQVLTSGATTNAYWSTVVTSVASGNGLSGGPITSTGTVSVLANTGIVANSTGLFVNATYIGTLTSNNTTNFAGQPASYYANAQNLTAGVLPTARLSGAYTGISQVGTLSTLRTSGSLGVNTTSPSVTLDVSSNDAIFVPRGTTLQRPTGANGMFRFNSDTSTFEGYSNGAWGTIAGSGAGGYYKGNLGATGNTNNKANLYRINSNTQSNNVTISTGENALTVGPMVIDSGFNLTIEEGGRAVII